MREIVERRSILRLLIARDLKVKYEGSTLGYFWSVLEPLLLAGVYWFVFGKVGRLHAPDYPLFIICTLLPWLATSSSISETTRSLTSQAKMVSSRGVPRELWVIRVIGADLVELVMSYPVVLLFAAAYMRAPSWYVFALPLAMLLQLVLLMGIGLFLSAVNVLYNDVQRLIRVVLRLTFYLSPVLYSVQVVENRLRGAGKYYEINPLAGIFELYRAAWFPREFIGWDAVGISAGMSVVVFVLGWRKFIKLEQRVLKEL